MKTSRMALAAAAASGAVLADVAQDRQAVAELLVASVAARTLMSVSIDQCTERFAQLVEPALDAKMEWDARNTPLEERARQQASRLASRIDAATKTAPKEYEAFRKALLAQAQSEATRKVRETIARDLAARPVAERPGLCRDLVRAVHDGKMDFPVTQPGAYRLLEGAK